MNSKTRNVLAITLVVGTLIALIVAFYLKPDPGQDMTYAEFRAGLNAGAIRQVLIEGDEISGTKANGDRFTTFNPGDAKLIEDLVEHHVDFRGVRPDKSKYWMSLVAKLLMFAVPLYFMRSMFAGLMNVGKNKAKLLVDDAVMVTFEDVAGCDEAKEDVKELVEFLTRPSKFGRLGGKIPKGVLMMGPPGTGKTLLARAIAGEAKVPFFSISGSDFVEMYVGLGASRVRTMFEQAKKKAPCIIFIDEIDAVGRQRGGGKNEGSDEREQTLNQLLVEMDGFTGNEGIIMIAATNRPEVLDKALLRPGRFDHHVVVGLPDVRGREQILAVYMKGVPLNPNVEPERLACGTAGFSGADLANLVNEAALFAARHDKTHVDMQDFERAKEKILMGSERSSAAMSEEEKKLTAYHEAGHALVGMLVPDHDPVYKISIIPRGRAMGQTMFLPERDQFSASKERLESQISCLYGGRLAEEIVFGPGKVTTGAQNDIERATQIAGNMIARWGYSEKVGPLFYGTGTEEGYLGGSMPISKSSSEETAQLIDHEIRELIGRNYDRAERMIRENIDTLHRLAEALMTHETLDRRQLDEILSLTTVISIQDRLPVGSMPNLDNFLLTETANLD